MMQKLKPYYPDDWKDDQTMDVLFSPFRETRDINPHSWDRKIKFWHEMIKGECIFSRSPIVDAKSLPRRFMRKDKNPVCLGKVLQELHSQGHIVKLSDLEKKFTQGWVSWGVEWFIKKPISWSWGKLFGSSPAVEGEYVLSDLLQNCADSVLERHYSLVQNEFTDNAVELSTLMSQCQDLVADDRTMRLVLSLLQFQKKLSIVNISKETIIRFVRQGKNNQPTVEEPEIDISIIRIKKTAKKLDMKIEEIYEEMERNKEEARQFLRKGQKNAAKSSLRRKKVLEQKLDKTLAAQDKLQEMMERIKDAESNKMILDAYSAGASAYKGMVSAYNLNPENVDKVMDDVNETLELDADVASAMAQGLPSLDVSTEELEDELNDIMASGDKPSIRDENVDSILEELDKLPLIDDDLGLPDVPGFDPSFEVPSRERVVETARMQMPASQELWTVKAVTSKSPIRPSSVVQYPSQTPIGFSPTYNEVKKKSSPVAVVSPQQPRGHDSRIPRH